MKWIIGVSFLIAMVCGGCFTYVKPSDAALIHTYKAAANETNKRIQADSTLPAWVKQSADADYRALEAIDAMATGKKVGQ